MSLVRTSAFTMTGRRRRAVAVVLMATLCAIAPRAEAQAPASMAIARAPDGKPDLSGFWQASNTAAWDIQDHRAQKGVPAGQGVVEGNEIDTLVVDLVQFNDRTWFDRAGNYHSDALHLTERFTSMSADVIWYEVTIDDPKVYTKPFTAKLYWRLSPDTQLIEFVCLDKDAAHYVGATPAK